MHDERLIEKVKENDYWDTLELHYGLSNTSQIVDKLGKVEDILEDHNIKTLEELDSLLLYVKKIKTIEEELGIDLITFINILKATKVYHKEYGWVKPDLYFFDSEDPKKWSFDTFDKDDNIRLLWIKDFGTLWVLAEEQLY